MPMKTRRHKYSAKCAHGLCTQRHHPDHHFYIDLGDGKPHIKISACTAEHLEELRKRAGKFVVP